MPSLGYLLDFVVVCTSSRSRENLSFILYSRSSGISTISLDYYIPLPLSFIILVLYICTCYTQHYASRSGHLKVCQLLISSGAGVNIQTPGGVTPLHRSAYCGRVEVVKLLLEHGADVGLKDSDGRTALHKVGWYDCDILFASIVPILPDRMFP